KTAMPCGWLQLEAAGPLDPDLDACLGELNCCRFVLPEGGPVAAFLSLAGHSTDEPHVDSSPTHLAAVGFTSGSTGAPLPVPIAQAALAYFSPMEIEAFAALDQHRVSLLASLSHSLFRRELLRPLMAGGTICIPSAEEFERPGRLASWLQRERITFARL